MVACLLMTVSAVVFFVRNLSHKQEKTTRQQLQDSINYHGGQAKIHKETADYHQQQYEKAWKIYMDSVNAYVDRDSMRAALRSTIRDSIRAKLGRQPDTLRATEAGHL